MTTSTNTPNAQPERQVRSPWRRRAIMLGLVAGSFALGAGTLAATSDGGPPWQGGGFGHGPRIGMIQFAVRHALENVGATTAQEDKIHDIVATTFTALDTDKDREGRDALRKQVLDLMRAPTLDRAAIEKLRADKVAEFDAKSKAIVAAVVDAASQLTPAQRVQLVQNAENRMAHPRWGGGQHRFGPGDGRGAPERGGPDRG